MTGRWRWGLPIAATLLAAGAAAAGPGLLDGGAIPVLVEVEAAGPAVLRLSLAPGEAPGDAADVAVAGAGLPAPDDVRIVAHHPDGSAARLEVRWQRPPAGRYLARVRPPRLADPARLAPAAPSVRGPGAPAAVGALVEAAFGGGPVVAEGAAPPPWWSGVTARLSRDLAPGDHSGQLELVEVAYAEKGRPREAIRLFSEIAEAARREDPRTALRACYQIAHLYEGALRDFPRALVTYLRCDRFPLADASEARQNGIAAGFGAARAVEGLGERAAALGLYRLVARDLLVNPDPYGDLVLPEVFLRIGDSALGAGDRPAAEGAYRAAVAAAGRLGAGVPSSFRAPGSAARAALRRLSARQLSFDRVPDGSYTGEAFGYNAPVAVRLTFEDGRCAGLHVTDLGDKRPLDAYRVLPERMLAGQSLEVDAVTGATVTSRALLSAATEAVFRAAGGEDDGD